MSDTNVASVVLSGNDKTMTFDVGQHGVAQNAKKTVMYDVLVWRPFDNEIHKILIHSLLGIALINKCVHWKDSSLAVFNEIATMNAFSCQTDSDSEQQLLWF